MLSAPVCKRSAILGKARHTAKMLSIARPYRSRLARHALMAIAFNCAIAFTITAFGNQSLMQNMVYSQLIGLSIWALIDVGRHLLHPQGSLNMRQVVVLTLVGSLVGYFLGSAAGDMVMGHPLLGGWQIAPKSMAGFLLMSLVAGFVLVYFFMSREVLMQARNERELAQRQATEAQLKLLQSQLDPHMLFNTLANLRALITHDPQRATSMLDQLVDFLRATLSASRTQEHSLQAEFDRLADYLALMQIRMGARLSYRLDLPAELAQVHVPSLILQSLVENAVLHGLEPQVEGGSVAVSATRENGQLVLRVQDDGAGCAPEALREGFGLAQVRERLASRYGTLATMDFIASHADSMPGSSQKSLKNAGCTVRVSIPLPT
jgi:Histidine kinase